MVLLYIVLVNKGILITFQLENTILEKKKLPNKILNIKVMAANSFHTLNLFFETTVLELFVRVYKRK